MAAHDPPSRRGILTATLLASLLIWWGFTCWLARDARPWAIRLTGYCFAAGLLASYLCAWGLAIVWARGPRRRMVLRAVATTLLMVVLVAMLEMPVLFGLVDYEHVWGVVTGEWRGPATNFITDMDLTFRRPANQKWTGRPTRAPYRTSFSTDAAGFRNQRDMDRADVALIGDSFIEGVNVSDEHTCSVFLERRIGRSVKNLGVSGYGTLQELAVLERYALPLQPGMVAWFFYEGNDLYNDEDFENALSYLRQHGSYSTAAGWEFDWRHLRKASFTVNTFLVLRRVSHTIVPEGVETFGWFRDERDQVHAMRFFGDGSLSFDDYERRRLETTRAAFRRGRDLCRERGVHLVVCYIPMKFRVYGEYCTFPSWSPCLQWRMWNLTERFGELCAEEEIDFMDLTVPMRRAAASGQVLYGPEESHWNVAGQAFVAERLREVWERYSTSAP